MSDTGAPSGGLDRVARELAACLPALHRALDRRVASAVPHPKPSEGQLLLLKFVEQQQGATVRAAADALLMKPNNVSALVSQLTALGLLERRQDSGDKRVAHLHLTPTAHRRLTEVGDLERAFLAEALRSLPEDELGALGAALDALASLTRRLHTAAH
ncbi:MarR family winged helix-turn-helix transcriptional regulator [Streptomyces sp. NPDC051677]|uniref:MarR family winged helix-turn-helix transcriptional regulator n=1 Tax=Streptomyces sp. NPDC051677 TaxID=3365669 RepID=UPI0037D12286